MHGGREGGRGGEERWRVGYDSLNRRPKSVMVHVSD